MPGKSIRMIVDYDRNAIIRLQNPMRTRQDQGFALKDNSAETTMGIRLVTIRNEAPKQAKQKNPNENTTFHEQDSTEP
jgi:hypothetical protein